MNQGSVKRIRVVAGLLVSLALVGGCGARAFHSSPPRHLPSSGPADATGTTDEAQSSYWANYGQQLLQFKAQAVSTWPPGSSLPGDAPAFAYESLPVTVTGDGVYTFDFGPVDSAVFNWPTSPDSVSVDWPDDTGFRIAASKPTSMVTINGQSYFQIADYISGVTRTYDDLTGWIY